MPTYHGTPIVNPAGDYTNIANVKALMPDQVWSTKYDAIFSTLITRSSRLIDGLLQREPGAFAVVNNTTRYFDGSGSDKLYIGELASVPTVVSVAESGIVDGATGTGGTYTVWAVRDYSVWPANRVQEGKPYLRLDIDPLNGSKAIWFKYPKSVKITGAFGFALASNIPPEIVGAAEIQTVRWWKRGQQAFQDAGTITELGQLRYVKKLDPDIEMTLMEGKFSWL